MTNIELYQVEQNAFILNNKDLFNSLDDYLAERIVISLDYLNNMQKYGFWEYHNSKLIIKAFLNNESFDNINLSF